MRFHADISLYKRIYFPNPHEVFHIFLDMADDRGGMEASGTRAPRALGHLVFLLINFSDVCSNFISFLRGRKGSGTRVFGQ